MNSIKLITILAVTAASSIFASGALAQVPEHSRETIPEVFERGYFHGLGKTWQQYNLGGQLNFMFGWSAFPQGSFPENQIMRQARILETLFRDQFQQQVESDPILRSRDLSSPFNTSIQQNPNYLRPLEPGVKKEVVIEEAPFYRP